MQIYEKSKSMLVDSLVYENGNPLNYYLNLELLYQFALDLKHHCPPTIRQVLKKYNK